MYDKFVFTAFLNPKCFKDFKHSPWFQPREHHTRRDNIVPPWLKPRAMSDKFVFIAFLNPAGFKDFKHSKWFQPREHHTRRDNIVPRG